MIDGVMMTSCTPAVTVSVCDMTSSSYTLELFVDTSFPPDDTSLTYVYSGDDKYEKMLFKRPKMLFPSPQLYGLGGFCAIPLPSKVGMDRNWFRVALAVVSVNNRFMEKIIPGYEQMEQGYHTNYVGCFRFRLWRFGEWIDVNVDDFLPVLDATLAYFPALTQHNELWGALLEKAYAKCHKAYEAIEVGNPVNAITDLSGAICEHISVRVEAPSTHFHLIYKSSVNRSLLVAIRTGKTCKMKQDETSKMYIISAVTMFPMRDGQLVEMLRLKDLFSNAAWWTGEFSLSHCMSWNRVNPAFMGSYRPRDCLQDDECWMSFIDFCYLFSDVFICSCTTPYEGLDKSDRRYPNHFAMINHSKQSSPDKNLNSLIVGRSEKLLTVPNNSKIRRASVEINVRESWDTIKVDNITPDESFFLVPPTDYVRRKSFSSFETSKEQKRHEKRPFRPLKSRVAIIDDIPDIVQTAHGMIAEEQPCYSSRNSSAHSEQLEISIPTDLSGVSNSSMASVNSIYSVSDIKIKVKSGTRRKSAPCRPKSTLLKPRSSSLSSSTSLSRLFDSRVDNFRSSGGWKELVWQFGKWTKSTAGGSRNDPQLHNRNPRIVIHVPQVPTGSDITAFPEDRGKCHLLVSLVQDYRQGARTAHSMLMTIGFCLYRCKHQDKPDKDEKKNLQKLQLIEDIKADMECRELTARFDLEAGYYLMVPYTAEVGQVGNFLVRVLAEIENTTNKNSCAIS